MAIIEVEEAELNNYKQARGLVDKFLNSAERKEFLKLYKKLHPEASIPELDTAAPIETKISEVDERHAKELKALRDEIDQERMNRKTTETIEKAREGLKRSGWNDDGIALIEKTMTERGLTDYDAAAALVEKNMPKPEAIAPTSGYTGRDFGLTAADPDNADDQKLLMSRNPADRNQFVDKRIRETLNLVRSGKLVA